MDRPEPLALLHMLRDPNQETGDIARALGVTREEAGRAARLALTLGRARAEELLALPAALALPLLEAASAAGRHDVVAAAAVHPQHEVAKAAKRLLYQLRLKGTPVPELPRAKAAPPPPPPEPALPCIASCLEGDGERIVWLARHVPGKGVEVVQAALSDERGLLEVVVGNLGRKEYRAMVKDLLQRGGDMGLAEVERAQALAWVLAAAQQNAASGTPLPEGASGWLGRAGPAPALADPADAFPALPEAEERQAVEASALLHELPTFRGWLAGEETLRALAARLDEISVSQLYIDEEQRQTAGDAAVEDALSAHLDETRRARWAARLFASAEHLVRLGDASHARLAAAAGRALRAAGSGAEAARIPFARLLVAKALAGKPGEATPRAPRAAPDPASLIVSPAYPGSR